MDVEIKTSKGTLVAEDVPITSWKDLKPYWKTIARVVIEIFLEGKFKPYSVSKIRKDGFYAYGYWL